MNATQGTPHSRRGRVWFGISLINTATVVLADPSHQPLLLGFAAMMAGASGLYALRIMRGRFDSLSSAARIDGGINRP